MTVATPPHLPRARLPLSSPSSARLRRLAPTPVKVPPTPPLIFSPPAAQGARLTTLGSALPRNTTRTTSTISSTHPTTTHSSESGILNPSPESEYEFAPLELSMRSELVSNCQAVLGSCRKDRPPEVHNEDRRPSLPLVFDSRGDFGRLSQSFRRSRGPDVPTDFDFAEDIYDEYACSEPVQRDGEVDMGPGEWFRHCVPKPVLVEFRDVFSTSKSLPVASSKLPEVETVETLALAGEGGDTLEEPIRTERDTSVAESFATFGPKGEGVERRPSTVSRDHESVYSFSFSAYHDDDPLTDDPPKSPESSYTTDQSPGMEGVAMFERNSLDSMISDKSDELVTPFQEVGGLDLSTIEGDDTGDGIPTPTPTPKSRPNLELNENSLGLDLGTPRPNRESLSADDCLTPQAWREGGIVVLNKSLPPTPMGTSPSPSVPLAEKVSSVERRGEFHAVELVEQALKGIDKGLTIQLWVDQEGTREVRSTLRYIRTIKPQVFREREASALKEADMWCESPTRPELFQQSGCWEFGMDPRARDRWHFHHAALEGLPVLRRLTINGDEKLDFLPRGATLQIRETGVYAVHGHEDKGRVEWKFEYLVTPRISPSTGEYARDEKILVPLALYISPTFLNPDRGLKTHLLNVFKKTLSPNIVAEKVKSPHLGTPPAKPLPTSNTTSNSTARSQQLPISASATTLSTSSSSGTPTSGGQIGRSLVGAIAKPFTSGNITPGSAVSPPLQPPAKYGPKTPIAKGRNKVPVPHTEVPEPPNGVGQEKEKEKEKEKETPLRKGRRRAASLFSRARPFTPPTPAEIPPLPTSTSLKNQASLLSLKPPPPPPPGSARSQLTQQGQPLSPLVNPIRKVQSRPSSLRPLPSASQVLKPSATMRARANTTSQRPVALGHSFVLGSSVIGTSLLKDDQPEGSLQAAHPFSTHLLPVALPKDVEAPPSFVISRPPPPPPSAGHQTPRTPHSRPTRRPSTSPGLPPPPPPSNSHLRQLSYVPEPRNEVLSEKLEVPIERDGIERRGITDGGKGLRPVRPAMRRRPSTAEPRLGF